MTTSASKPPILTVDDFASEYGIPVNTVRHWVQTGEAPPSARIGRRRYFKRADIDAWIDAKFTGTAR